MKQKTKRKFRVGQRVQSAADPTQTFVIRRSLVPERIYYGANRWWTKSELQGLGEAENPAKSIHLNGKGKCVGMRAKCVQGVSVGLAVVDRPASGLMPRECLGCPIVFQPTRDWQRFHSASCRYAYWRRQRSPRKRPQIMEATA